MATARKKFFDLNDDQNLFNIIRNQILHHPYYKKYGSELIKQLNIQEDRLNKEALQGGAITRRDDAKQESAAQQKARQDAHEICHFIQELIKKEVPTFQKTSSAASAATTSDPIASYSTEIRKYCNEQQNALDDFMEKNKTHWLAKGISRALSALVGAAAGCILGALTMGVTNHAITGASNTALDVATGTTSLQAAIHQMSWIPLIGHAIAGLVGLYYGGKTGYNVGFWATSNSQEYAKRELREAVDSTQSAIKKDLQADLELEKSRQLRAG